MEETATGYMKKTSAKKKKSQIQKIYCTWYFEVLDGRSHV